MQLPVHILTRGDAIFRKPLRQSISHPIVWTAMRRDEERL